ncbi:MAG: ABC transporter permease [Candidatus Thermoplasmatota archaeon]|nr:ABC transporter permease [Candidatus Thermoplasmatota archaeon]
MTSKTRIRNRKNNLRILKNNLKFTAKNLYKQWKVFYRSNYGKVGFYILVVFIIISILAPFIVHGNPFAAVPSEDYFSPVQELNHNLNFTPVSTSYDITTSDYTTSGSYYIFMAGHHNNTYAVYAISTKNATSGNLFNINETPQNLHSFTAYNITTLLPQEVLEVSTNHTIYLADVNCTYNPISENSSVRLTGLIKANYNGTILSSFISSKTYQFNPPSGLIGQFLSNAPYNPDSYVFSVTANDTGYYLNSYFSYNLQHYWSVKLTRKPTNVYYYGNEFVSPRETRIFLTEGKTLNSYFYNGTLAYSKNFSTNITSFVIPSFYQSTPAKNNSAFLDEGRAVYQIYLINGTEKLVYTSSSDISAIGVSSGSNGFPTNFIISSGLNIYVLAPSKNSTILSVANTISLPFSINNIRFYSSGTFLLSNTTSGSMLYLIDPHIKYPFSWHASIGRTITPPIMFVNPWLSNSSLQDAPAIGLLSGSDLIIYSFEGKAAPIPPTLHTVSGIPLPLGTNTAGNNIWVIFIDSFPVDLEVGFAAGVVTVLISVVVSMLIGYYSGIVSSFWETISLAIFLIPGLPLFIVLATVLGPTLFNLILIFSLLGWPFVTFSLIGVVRSIKGRTFIESAIVSNLSTTKIMKRHILPNMGTLLAYLTAINIGGSVAAVSTYEILGLAPLTIPTWGGMLNGFLGDYFSVSLYPWIYIPALTALSLFILAFIFISRGIDEVANPRLGERR